jgi:hypothetical protein
LTVSSSEQADNNHEAFTVYTSGQVLLTGNEAITSGINTFKLKITDTMTNLTDEQIVSVNVTITNTTPTIVAAQQSKSVPFSDRDSQTVLFSGTFSDSDNDPVTMSLLSGTIAGVAVDLTEFTLTQDNNDFTISSLAGHVLTSETYVFQVQATDGNLTQQSSARVDVLIAPSVSAQSIDFSTHHLFVNVLDTAVGNVDFSLEGTGVLSVLEAPGNDNNHSAFSVTSQGAVKLSGNQAVNDGAQTFLLRVTDSDNGSFSEALVTINVTLTNATPAISGPLNTLSTPISNASNSLLLYQNGIFSDADADPVTVNLVGVTIDGVAQDLANFTLTAANGAFSINSVQSYTMTSGEVVFQVSSTDQFDVTTTNVTTNYSISPEVGANQQFNLSIVAGEEGLGDLGSFQIVGNGESALAYSLSSHADVFSIDENTGVLTTKGQGNLVSQGTNTVSVTVTDTVNLSQASGNVDIIVEISRVVENRTISNVTTSAESLSAVNVGQGCVVTGFNNNLILNGGISVDSSSTIGDNDDVIRVQDVNLSGGVVNYASLSGTGTFTNCQLRGPTGRVLTLTSEGVLSIFNSSVE